MEAGGALAPALLAAFSLPCVLLLLALGRAGLRVAAAAAALRGLRGGHAWPTRSAFLGYRVTRPAAGGAYPSVFRDDDEPPLPPECCDRLALAVYRRNEKRRGGADGADGPEPECVFCLSAVGDGEEVRELRCCHVFHRACLDAWLVRPRATCPLCRDRLLPADDPPRPCTAADDDGYGLEFEDDARGDGLSSSPPGSVSARSGT